MASTSAFAAQFPEQQFRDAIRASMQMGMPESDDEKLIWRWNRQKTFVPSDPRGRPYDFTKIPVTDEPGNPEGDAEDDGVIIDYALTIRGQDETITSLGPINAQELTVTIFDVDWERIKDADYAQIGDVTYDIKFEAPPYGLFAVTMHDVYLEARDEH